MLDQANNSNLKKEFSASSSSTPVLEPTDVALVDSHQFFGPEILPNGRIVTTLHKNRVPDLRNANPRFRSESTTTQRENNQSIPLAKTELKDGFFSRLMFGNKDPSAVLHAGTYCDSCKVSPIQGYLWKCSTCIDYTLCNACYEAGVHGMENTKEMETVQAVYIEQALRKIGLSAKLINYMRIDICHNDYDKFEYFSEWLCEILLTKNPSTISVRGLEIPHLLAESRQKFVSLLMPLACIRQDLEMNFEWAKQTTLENVEKISNNENLDEETLRIWISDKLSRTTSPFK